MENLSGKELDHEDFEVFENDIEMCLADFQEENSIQNLKEESQSIWNAALLYIYKRVFKNTDRLKMTVNYCTGNLLHGNSSNNNAYDIDKVNDVLDIYINLCYKNDKEVSVLGFNKLTGIVQDTIYSWGRGDTQSGSSASEIYKKLNQEREESLSNKLLSGKNPVGILGILNHSYNWNMPGVREQKEQKPQNLEQIKEKYITAGTAANPQIEPPKAEF